jgi:hypothetical protein
MLAHQHQWESPQISPLELKAWLTDEPSSQYARRAGFLFEFFTWRELDIYAKIGGHYIDALDDQKLVTASPKHSIPNLRWRSTSIFDQRHSASRRSSEGPIDTTCLINNCQRTGRAAVLCPDSRSIIAAAYAIHDGDLSLCI